MIKLFSGSNNSQLTSRVTKLSNIPLSASEVIRFEDSEVRVQIQEDVTNHTAIILESTSSPTDTSFMELFFFCDALKRGGAKKIIGIIPYFGYARQNIQHRPGEAISANVIIKFLETVGFDEVWTLDLHDEATSGIFSIVFKNLSALPILARYIKASLGKEKNIVIASPDQGGVERARIFGKSFFGKKESEIVVVEKERNLENIHESKAIDIHGEVKGKAVILVDDIVTSGGTLINAAELCLNKGAKRVVATFVHHDFSQKAPYKLQNSLIEKFFTTDTIFLKEDHKFPKLKEITIASIISEELKNSHHA